MLSAVKPSPSGFLILLYLLLALPLFAQDAKKEPAAPAQIPVQATARELTYDRENQILTLTGNVVIVKPPFTIYGPEMQIDLKTNVVRALKSVEVVRNDQDREREVIVAENAELNLDTDAGWMINGKMTLPTQQEPVSVTGQKPPKPGEGQITISGERLEKINETQYLFKNGSLTSCQCSGGQKPDWGLEAKEINADTQSTAKLHSARILIRGAKIFYLPYWEVPISDQRKSGLLPPEFGYSSRTGYYAGIPYYLALGPSADLTVYPTWYSERGLMAGAEFRHNLGPISAGDLEGYAIEDSKEHQWRWSGSYQGESSWGSGWLREDLRMVSDNEYIRDFPQELSPRSARELDSKIVASQSLPYSSLSGELKWAEDIAGWDLREIPEFRPDQDQMVIQQLPAVSYQLFNLPIYGPIGFDLRGMAEDYWHEQSEFGRAVQGDLFPRLTFAPYLAPGLRVFSFAGYKVGAFSPYYSEADPETVVLGRPVAGADLSLAMERIFNQDKTEGNKYRNLLEPGLVVLYQGPTENPDDPFLQRLTNSRENGIVGLKLDSLLFQKKIAKGTDSPRVLSEMEINQFYSWVNRRWLDTEFKGYVQSPRNFGVETDLFFNPEKGRWRRAYATAWVEDRRKDRFLAGYIYSDQELRSYWYSYQQDSAQNWMGGTDLVITDNLGINYRINYSVEYQMLDSQSLMFNYLARQKCWMLSLKISEGLNPEHPDRNPDFSTAVYFQLLTGSQLATGPEWIKPKESSPPPPTPQD